MKSHKRSDTVAVGRKAITRHAYHLGTLLLKWSVVCHMQIDNKIP